MRHAVVTRDPLNMERTEAHSLIFNPLTKWYIPYSAGQSIFRIYVTKMLTTLLAKVLQIVLVLKMVQFSEHPFVMLI
jgi:hypothetical protein